MTKRDKIKMIIELYSKRTGIFIECFKSDIRLYGLTIRQIVKAIKYRVEHNDKETEKIYKKLYREIVDIYFE